MENLNELFLQREIIRILIGDSPFGEIEGIQISMPYLSGPNLCSLLSMFGRPTIYPQQGGAKSRWEYMTDLLQHCIENGKFPQLLSYIFNKEQFRDKFSEYITTIPHPKVDSLYTHIITEIIKAINCHLNFGGHELKIINGQFVISKIGAAVKIEAPKIKQIDRQYIAGLSERASKDIDEKAFDSAITKSRTLLEEVFCYVIEMKGVQPSDKGNIKKLYNQVKELYNMHTDKSMDVRINTLLSGLETIIEAIAEMRNKNSDAHGVGSKRRNIEEHHTRLFLNSSIAMSDFILAVGERNKKATSS
jgi:hypothetical protein